MKNKILSILMNNDGFVSGEKISRELGISRNCVWKNIEKLKSDGNEIESLKNSGYRLLSTADLVCPPYINPKTEFIGKQVIYFDKIDSTNKAAKDTPCVDGSLFISDMQTNGRGRMGKNWESPGGCGIFMSIAVNPQIDIEKIMQISLAAGIAVCDVLNAMFNIDCKIKWPNDIVCSGKKLCGILVEANIEERNVSKVVAGIGINVNNDSFPGEISDMAVSLKQITKKSQKRADIVNNILLSFEKYYKLLIYEDGLDKILNLYKTYCVNIGKKVVSTLRNEKICGTAVDISPIGELVIKTDDGKKITVNSGEVSVRGIYGYV